MAIVSYKYLWGYCLVAMENNNAPDNKPQAKIDLENERIIIDGTEQEINDFDEMSMFLLEQAGDDKIDLEAI